MKILISVFVTSVILLMSCVEASQENIKVVKVSKLLQRAEKIQLGKEWEAVQNKYVKEKLKIQNDSSDLVAKLNLAELFVREARVTGEHGHYYPAALKLMNQIIDSKPEDLDILFRSLTTKAGVLLSLHEFPSALSVGLKALAMNSKSAQIHGVLTDCYVELGEYEKAVSHADKMVAIKPDIRSYSRISYLREIHGDIPGAISALEIAIKSGYPGYEETAWAMLTLGDLYFEYGQIDKAEHVYKQILTIRKDYPFAIAALGKIALAKGDLEKANTQLQNAIDIIPEIGFYTAIAKTLLLDKQIDSFEHKMNEIFIMLEEDVKSGHNMNMEYANIYIELYEDYDKALEYINEEYIARPKNIDVNRILSSIYFQVEKLDFAKKHLELASITNSVHPDLKDLKENI